MGAVLPFPRRLYGKFESTHIATFTLPISDRGFCERFGLSVYDEDPTTQTVLYRTPTLNGEICHTAVRKVGSLLFYLFIDENNVLHKTFLKRLREAHDVEVK